MENNTNERPLLQSFRKYNESDYDILVPDDPKPVKYQYRDPDNAPGNRKKGTKTCTTCHQYKNGVGHSKICTGPCVSIDTCPTEYFTSQKGHVEIEHRYLQNVNERASRVKAWVTKKNEEQERAKSAYAKEKQVYQANETARQQELFNKTRFSMPTSLVPKSNGKHKNPEGLSKAVSLTLKRKIEEYNSPALKKKPKLTASVGASFDYAIGLELESDAEISTSDATEKSVAESEVEAKEATADLPPEPVLPKRKPFKSLQERREHERKIVEFETEEFIVDFTGITDLEEFDKKLQEIFKRKAYLEYLINY